MNYLTAEDLLNIHAVIIAETGGSHGVRDSGALASLELLSQQTAFGKELYPGLYIKGAVYARNIIFNHPFVDGNKRSAMASMDVFLQLNGYRINTPKGGIENFALSIIEHKHSLEEIAEWLEMNSEAS
jgi:death-on-curing protein